MESTPTEQNEALTKPEREWQSGEILGFSSNIERKRKFDHFNKLKRSNNMLKFLAGFAMRTSLRKSREKIDTASASKAEKRRLEVLWRFYTRRELKPQKPN